MVGEGRSRPSPLPLPHGASPAADAFRSDRPVDDPVCVYAAGDRAARTTTIHHATTARIPSGSLNASSALRRRESRVASRPRRAVEPRNREPFENAHLRGGGPRGHLRGYRRSTRRWIFMIRCQATRLTSVKSAPDRDLPLVVRAVFPVLSLLPSLTLILTDFLSIHLYL